MLSFEIGRLRAFTLKVVGQEKQKALPSLCLGMYKWHSAYTPSSNATSSAEKSPKMTVAKIVFRTTHCYYRNETSMNIHHTCANRLIVVSLI